MRVFEFEHTEKSISDYKGFYSRKCISLHWWHEINTQKFRIASSPFSIFG